MKIILVCFLLFTSTVFGQTLIQQAAQFYGDKNWEKAESVYRLIVEENPWHGDYWYRLGWSAYNNRNFDLAADALERSAPLTAFPGRSWYNAACSAALAGGEPERAMEFLKKAMKNGFNNPQYIRADEDLSSLRSLPQFRELFAEKSGGLLPVATKWREDLAFLDKNIREYHIKPFHTLPGSEWEMKVRELHDAIPQLTDLQVIGEMMKLVASIGDGHTNFFVPFHGEFSFHTLPVRFGYFKDGIFVQAASKDFTGILGAKVLRFGGKTAEEIAAAFARYAGVDNEWQTKMMLDWQLQFMEMYVLEGASDKTDELGITVQLDKGIEKSLTLPAFPVRGDLFHNPVPDDWVIMNHQAGNPVPLWLKNPHVFYWLEEMPVEKMVYANYSRVQNSPHGESIAEFTERLRLLLEKSSAEYLVLDIRSNRGGNNFLNKPLVQAIIRSEKINQPGKLFVIIGRNTFSAGMNLASDLERQTNATFVGEPTGSSPNNYGEHFDFNLPHSGLTVSCSVRYFQGGFTSDDRRPWIAPDLAAEMTAADFRNNVDPAMEAIRKYIEGN